METKAKENFQLDKIKSAAEQRFDAVKKAAIEIKDRCMKIDIKDDVTLALANQTLSEANTQLNLVEEKRKALKKPYFDAGKIIDEAAKQISGPLEEAIDAGRKKLKEWNDAQEILRKKKEEELNKNKVRLEAIENQLQIKADACATPLACEQLMDSIKAKFPDPETFGQYKQEAAAAKERYIKLLTIKKDALVGVIAGGAGSAAAALAAQQANEIMKQEAQNSIQQAEQKREAVASGFAIGMPKSKVRKTWKAEVIDESQIPREWLCPDMEKIKAYMDANKSQLKSPTIVNGVKFFQEETPVIR